MEIPARAAKNMGDIKAFSYGLPESFRDFGEGFGMSDKVCIACESPMGEPHEEWCPTQTGTLSSLDRRPKENKEI